MHTSLDGFIAGPNGELNWAKLDNEIFDFVDSMTANADTALYGRVTYQLMESYWPTAADKPNATKHDKTHSVWYKNVSKVVLSTTLNNEGLNNTVVVSDQLVENINGIKNQAGRDILIFGSPSASMSLMRLGLIDEFWLFVNPVLLGQGKPLFKDATESTQLTLLESKKFASGVIALHYAINRIG